MPGEGYEYIVGLKDESSSPAKAIVSALNELTAALGKSGSAVRSSGEHHREAAEHVKEHESAIKSLLSSASKAAGVGGLFAAAAGGTLVAHLAEKAGELAVEGVKFTVEASEFKENTIQAYAAIKGTAEEGEETFRELDKTAREIHMPAEKAHEMAQALMLEGLNSQKAITDTIRAVGALQSTGLAAGADKLQSIVSRSLASGKLEVTGKSLTGTGVNLEGLYDELSGSLGIGREQVKAQLDAGKIDVETGIQAIDSAILKGKIGQLAAKKFTISDAFVDMKNSIRGVLQETDSSPITDAIKRVSDSFVGTAESAKDTKEAINGLISVGGLLVDVVGGIADIWKAEFGAIKWAIEGTISSGKKLLGIIRELAGGFQSKEDKAYSAQAQKDIDKRLDKEIRTKIERAKIDQIESFGRESHTKEEVHSLGKKLNVDLFKADEEELGGTLSGDAKTTRAQIDDSRGSAIAATLPPKDAFESSIRDLSDLGKNSALSLQAGYKDANRQHSPSAAMYEIGEQSATSLQSGASAAAKLSDRPVDRPDAGRRVDVHVGGIHLHGLARAEEFMPLLESQVADVFERVALELGQ